ncbi:MAG TPA: aminotransferase class V-fold PLP-dependent enzyme [Methylomirabilota bacterium]|nr:aminotransferase class V-fold PLP-dependent enzyme [Methylomirabilota bacterium]
MPPLPPPSELARHWDLDPGIVFLNHGSFGACPRPVLAAQQELRTVMEAEPVRFFVRELPGLVETARAELAAFVGADPEGLAFVTNATTGVNTALAALPLAAGDEVLVTDHGYPACRNAVEVASRRVGATLVEARLPYPLEGPEAVIETVLDRLTPRTRAAVLDHVTSPTGLVLPVAELAAELDARGLTLIVDGAHAPGMLDLELDALAAPFYTGNCHKWLCAPKGAGFLWVRKDWRLRTRPLVTSHGWSAPLHGRSRLLVEFDWTGTCDPTPWLTVPHAIDAVAGMVDGGWPEVRARNRRLALAGRSVLCQALGVAPPCPDELVASLAAVPLPDRGAVPDLPPSGIDPLQDRLYREHHVEVPVTRWGQPPSRTLRISAQLYNSLEQVRFLASVLPSAIG